VISTFLSSFFPSYCHVLFHGLDRRAFSDSVDQQISFH
jgi:hypothetical protein